MFENSRYHSCSANNDELVAGFLAVRRALGLLGLSLPFLLYFYAQTAPKGEMQPSISEFYHTAMGDVLVGVLVAIGVFLIAYVGHKPQSSDKLTDWWVSTIAGIGALGVALFPVVPQDPPSDPSSAIQGIVAHWGTWWEGIHFVSAAVFFLCMALFCFYLFPYNGKDKIRYLNEAGNTTYLICGVFLLFAIGGMAVYLAAGDSALGTSLKSWNALYWLEAIGVLAFAIAWLTKGNAIGGFGNLVARATRVNVI